MPPRFALRFVAVPQHTDFLVMGSGVAGLTFALDVATSLLRLSPRYPSERGQPGRALAIAEIAIARAERLSQTEIAAADIAALKTSGAI